MAGPLAGVRILAVLREAGLDDAEISALGAAGATILAEKS